MCNQFLLHLIDEFSLENAEAKAWCEQAVFGYHEIADILEDLQPEAIVCEVGSGSNILGSIVKQQFPSLNYVGIEPFGPGFTAFTAMSERLAERNHLTIINDTYHNVTEFQFDLIFCVNVIEHLEDWKDFLTWIDSQLKTNGKAVLLFPNNGFPIESHFKIPIIVNKNITGRLYQKKIEEHEARLNCDGLWKSLNFITTSQLRKECKKRNLSLAIDPRVNERMIEKRLDHVNFRHRQRFLCLIGDILKRLNCIQIVAQDFFIPIQPYCKALIRKN